MRDYRRKKCGIYIVIIILFCMMIKMSPVQAGFGDYNDYDSGSSDFGGSDSYDYGSSWDSDDYDGEGRLLTPAEIVAIVLIIAIGAIVINCEDRRRKQASIQSIMNDSDKSLRLKDRTKAIENLIRERDLDFSAEHFISYVKKVYILIQDAWCRRDLEPVRNLLQTDLYEMTDCQIQDRICKGIVNHLDRICVNTTYLSGYKKDESYEYITVYMYAQMVDYQCYEATGEMIKGDRDTRWNMYYRMVFSRSLKVLTPKPGQTEQAINCPNCGAALASGSAGKCPYCGSVVKQDNHGWVLQEFGVIKPDTVDEGIIR